MSEKLNLKVVPLSEAPPAEDVKKRRPVVLIVDDERVIADTLAAILTNSGFAPLVAYDGKSALEIAEAIPPELLISDVVMPGMNGIELAIAIVHAVADCKVLLFSGQASTVDLLADARTQGHHFTTLTKPIHPTELLARVSDFLRTPDLSYGLNHVQDSPYPSMIA
jgi:DNA-binding response OmpR family regulator